MVEPLFRDRLELAEEMKLRLLAGVTPPVEQPLREAKEHGRAPHLVQVLKAHVDALTDDALDAGDGRADEVGGQLEGRLFGEGDGHPIHG